MKSVSATIVLLVLLVGHFSGCGSGGPDIASVQGTVTLDGKPLPRADVVFIPTGGRPAAAETDANGKYVLEFSGGRKGAIPGKSRVEINTARPPAANMDGTVTPGAKEMVPAKYNKNTTLVFEVVDGQKNIADFKLESGGKVFQEAGAY